MNFPKETKFALRIYTCDHYLSPIIQNYDVCDEFRTPVLRIFGATPAGKKV